MPATDDLEVEAEQNEVIDPENNGDGYNRAYN
jgi:hypothetical protein